MAYFLDGDNNNVVQWGGNNVYQGFLDFQKDYEKEQAKKKSANAMRRARVREKLMANEAVKRAVENRARAQQIASNDNAWVENGRVKTHI